MVDSAPPRRRGLIVALTALLAVIVLAWEVVALFVITYGCDSGDGGQPFTAPASPRGHACDVATFPPLQIALLILAVGLVVWGGRRLLRGGGWQPLAVGVVVAALIPVVLGSAVNAFKDECSPATKAADPTGCESY